MSDSFFDLVASRIRLWAHHRLLKSFFWYNLWGEVAMLLQPPKRGQMMVLRCMRYNFLNCAITESFSLPSVFLIVFKLLEWICTIYWSSDGNSWNRSIKREFINMTFSFVSGHHSSLRVKWKRFLCLEELSLNYGKSISQMKQMSNTAKPLLESLQMIKKCRFHVLWVFFYCDVEVAAVLLT